MRSLLTKAFDALWAIPGTDRQIVRKASEPIIPWVRSSPGWPIRYHRSYPKTQDGATPKRKKLIPEYLEPDEVNAIIRAAPNPKAKLLMLEQWRAGLRVSEALDLEVRDLSLDTSTPTLRVRSGKGGKTRLVPVHPELHGALSSALAYGDISQGKLIEAHTTTAWRWVQAALKRAEKLGAIAPGKRIGTHTLCHSYARHLLMTLSIICPAGWGTARYRRHSSTWRLCRTRCLPWSKPAAMQFENRIVACLKPRPLGTGMVRVYLLPESLQEVRHPGRGLHNSGNISPGLEANTGLL